MIDLLQPKKQFVPRPAESPQVIEARWRKKKERIREMSVGIRRLRVNVSRDINQTEDEKLFLTALIIAIMDVTAERIGNEESEKVGHIGITGLQDKNVIVSGDSVTLDYVGKSGVKHEKCFTNDKIATGLKRAIKNSPDKFIFTTTKGLRIKSGQVNKYLEEFSVSSKNLRGYSANKWVIEKLNKIEPEDTDKKRKKQINKILKDVAGRVGHGKSTLKKHYLIPELWDEFVNNGKVIDISDLGYLEKGGEVEVASSESMDKGEKPSSGKQPSLKSISDGDKKYINFLMEYVYYNNPEEDLDEYAPSEAPEWIIKGSYEYLKEKGINKIYRGVGKVSYKEEDAYSWTYNKDVAKNFGDKIIEKPLPKKVISPEFVFDWVNKNKYIPYGATSNFSDYIREFSGGEEEVIVIVVEEGGEVPKSEQSFSEYYAKNSGLIWNH